MIDLPQARALREQLSPAFAGYVTDGNVSDRDVLATLMDLIVRGHIGLDAKTQKTPVEISKIYYVNNPGSLRPFERTFIDLLFSEKRELSPDELRAKFSSGKFHELILHNIHSLAETKIAKSLLILHDKKGKRLTPDVIIDINFEKKVRTVADLEKYKRSRRVVFAIFLTFMLIYGGIGVFFLMKNEMLMMAIFFGLMVISTCILLPILLKQQKVRKSSKLLLFEFENDIVPYTKKRYEELFEFISKYPLKTQRIYNEFMPHAVAFGLNTSWNASFGIAPEGVWSSRNRGDSDLAIDNIEFMKHDSELIVGSKRPPTGEKGPLPVDSEEFLGLSRNTIKSNAGKGMKTGYVLLLTLVLFIIFFTFIAILQAGSERKPLDRLLEDEDTLMGLLGSSLLFSVFIFFIALIEKKEVCTVRISKDWLLVTQRGYLTFKIPLTRVATVELGLLANDRHIGICSVLDDKFRIEVNSYKDFEPYFDSVFRELGVEVRKTTRSRLGFGSFLYPPVVYELQNSPL